MFYKKPKNITYTGMAIFIDNHPIFNINDEFLENTIFEYIYHLVYMLAVKQKYFKNSLDYDNFSIYVASIVFFRLKKKSIKSVLNYLKAILYFKKIEYENDNCLVVNKEYEDNYIYEYTFSNQMSDIDNTFNSTEFFISLTNIDKSIKKYLKRIPYKENSIMWNNIYISCLLTFLDQITVSNKTLELLNSDKTHTEKYFSKILKDSLDKESCSTNAVLYHLDKDMNDYIIVLVRLIKQFIANSLSYTCHTSISYSDINGLILNDINGYSYGDYYE